MFVFGNVLMGLGQVLNLILNVYLLILVLRAILSWVGGGDLRNPIVSFLYMMTEPPRRRIQGWLPRSLRNMPLDISFLVLFGLVIFLQYGIVPSIRTGVRRSNHCRRIRCGWCASTTSWTKPS